MGNFFSGVFFIGGFSKILSDENSTLLKLISLGGMFLSSIAITKNTCKPGASKEYKININQETKFHRSVKILTPVFKTTVITFCMAMEIYNLQSSEQEENLDFLQGCFGGFALATLMESIVSWQMVKKLAETRDKWDCFLSLLTTGALAVATTVRIQNGKAESFIENVSLISAGGLRLLHSLFDLKQKYSKHNYEALDTKNIQKSYSYVRLTPT
jgi:hypothetical protein